MSLLRNNQQPTQAPNSPTVKAESVFPRISTNNASNISKSKKSPTRRPNSVTPAVPPRRGKEVVPRQSGRADGHSIVRENQLARHPGGNSMTGSTKTEGFFMIHDYLY